jgi:hypothetical protein
MLPSLTAISAAPTTWQSQHVQRITRRRGNFLGRVPTLADRGPQATKKPPFGRVLERFLPMCCGKITQDQGLLRAHGASDAFNKNAL